MCDSAVSVKLMIMMTVLFSDCRSLHICGGSEPADRQEHASGDLCGHRGGPAAGQRGRHVRQDRSHGALQTQGVMIRSSSSKSTANIYINGVSFQRL